MKYNIPVLGEKIKIERNKLGLSRETLAEVLNISSSFLGLVERGERRLSIENLCLLAETLNLSIDVLLSANQTSEIHDTKQNYSADNNLHRQQLLTTIQHQLLTCSYEELTYIQNQIALLKTYIFDAR